MDSDLKDMLTEVPEEVSGFKFEITGVDNLVILPRNIAVRIDQDGKNLSQSPNITLGKNESEFNWEFKYEVPELCERVISSLIAHPFLFTVLYEVQSDIKEDHVDGDKKRNIKGKLKKNSKSTVTNESKTSKKSVKSGGSDKSKSPPTKKSISTISSTEVQKLNELKPDEAYNVLGVTNLDILPLLLGRDEMKEVLPLYPVNDERGCQAVAWEMLPLLRLSVTGTGGVIPVISSLIANVMHFTLESLHNPPFDLAGVNIEVATILPGSQDFSVAKFVDGVIVNANSSRSFPMKKWFGVTNILGQGALSPYRISNDIVDLKNTMNYEINRGRLEIVPRVEWHHLCRSYLTESSQQGFKERLISFRCWPIEIFTYSNTGNIKSNISSKGNKNKELQIQEENHYIAFLDLTSLLYPGVTATRVTVPLWTYVEGAIERRFGYEPNMFNISRLRTSPIVKTSKPAKSVASKKDKSQATTPKSTKKLIVHDVEELVEEVTAPPPEPEPVYNHEGEPVFIIVKVELHKPLVEKKTENQVMQSICSMIPERLAPSQQQQTTVNVTEMYEAGLESLMNIIHQEYQLFFTKNERFEFESSCKNFLMHLHVTGAYTRMKESIKDSLEAYAKDQIFLPSHITFPDDNQGLLTEIFTKLVGKMYTMVNNASAFNICEYDPLVSYDDLLFYSCEAFEEGSFDKAQEYLLERIEKSKKCDPAHWLDLAMFYIKRLEFEKAGECAREAVALDYRHIPSLLFLGLLSWLMEDLPVAELFLSAVVSFDPHNMEGWLTLYMIHKQNNSLSEASAELINGKQCRKDLISEHTSTQILMTWASSLAEGDRVFLLTAMRLIKMGFPELAEVALSYDLLAHGRTGIYLYYLAVCHYQQGRYTDSLCHLDQALTLQWENGHLWSLKGHNLYKMRLNKEAEEAFQVALNFTDNNINSHLIRLRLGGLLLEKGNHEEAKQYYLTLCKTSPSPLTWLGLGITSFMDNELSDAELALEEANMLDGRLASVWGYLALVNLLMARYPVYNCCLQQAQKYGLDDPTIIDRLRTLGEFVQETTA